jgi:hypothetical protein
MDAPAGAGLHFVAVNVVVVITVCCSGKNRAIDDAGNGSGIQVYSQSASCGTAHVATERRAADL